MKAYVYGPGGATISDVAQPKPEGTQVLVRVRACGLNRADTGMRKGHAHGAAGGAGTVLGMEWAGEVAALGLDAKGLKVGDRIMGSGGAAFAEYTLADHGRLFHTPSNMNFEEATTLPVALATMHNAVVTIGGVQSGQAVLIQGASSGVGLMAMQIAKLKGARLVIGSSTDATRRGRLKEYGADLAGASPDPSWVDEVLKATNGEGVDLIVDQVSGKVASQNLAATKVKGRIVNAGRLGGPHAHFHCALAAAPTPIATSTCTRPAASTMSASPSAPAPSRKSARSSTRSRRTSGARSSRENCSCRSTRCLPSMTSTRHSSTWRPTSISARSS